MKKKAKLSPWTMLIMIKCIVLDTIGWFSSHISEYVDNPGKDFTRKRSLSVFQLLLFLLTLKGSNIPEEKSEFAADTKKLPEAKGEMPSAPAILQARRKIHIELFQDLFHKITEKLLDLLPSSTNYRLTDKSLLSMFDAVLAGDGSDIVAPVLTKPSNENQADHGYKKVNGYHQLFHVDALLNIAKNVYTDVCFCLKEEVDERCRIIEMMARSAYTHALLILDRGYESYEMIYQCINRGWDFVIRIKDINSSGICRKLVLPNTPEFDVIVNINLVNRLTNANRALIKAQPNNYRYVSWKQFSAFPQNPRKSGNSNSVVCPISFRIVRIEIKPGVYEVLITSLPQDKFPPEKLKQIYWLRWGIETSFRRIKYQVNLANIHSVKSFYIFQELYCRFTMFNIASAVTGVVEIPHPETYKYEQEVDFSQAVTESLMMIRGHKSPKRVAKDLPKCLHSIKPGRQFERNLQPRNSRPFNGRGAA